MRQWQFWWHSVTLASRQCPPRFVEAVMLVLAAMFCAVWFVSPQWYYLVLVLSYITGAIASILVRESIAPSSHTQQVRLTAVLSFVLFLSLTSLYVAKTTHVTKSLGL